MLGFSQEPYIHKYIIHCIGLFPDIAFEGEEVRFTLMTNLKNHVGGKVIAIQVGGILSASNYYELAPSLIVTSLQSKKNLYFEIKILEKWEYATLYRHADAFNKVAIVSDKEQEVAINKVIDTFTLAEGRYYSTSQKEEAWDWVMGEG